MIKKTKSILLASALLVSAFTATSNAAGNDVWSVIDQNVCAAPNVDEATCFGISRQYVRNGQIVSTPNLKELLVAASQYARFNAQKNPNFTDNTVVALTGADLVKAYGINTNLGDAGKVIAIIDAYHSTNAYNYLTEFRTANGLKAISDCTNSFISKNSSWPVTSSSANPCFVQVNQNLGSATNVTFNEGWSNEIDLDIQAASAICPNCSILLVEANDASLNNLGIAITAASKLGFVTSISNSYGTGKDYSQTTYKAWNEAGALKPVFASTGDAGYQTSASFPASNTNVIGVGGTTLSVGSDGVRIGETAWSGAGSGCSTSNTKPTWQSGLKDCKYKQISDVSAVADPNSGLAVFTTIQGFKKTVVFGGTSLASPIIAALHALRGGYSKDLLSTTSTNFSDVRSGSNGPCRSALCKATSGWDGPTGLGSIK